MITYIIILFFGWLFFGWWLFLYMAIGFVVLWLLMELFPDWFDV